MDIYRFNPQSQTHCKCKILPFSKHKTLFQFSGVEKKNDDFRRFFQRKINKWDTCKDLLIVEKRMEKLKDSRRVPRTYEKRKKEFWEEGGKQAAVEKHKNKISKNMPSLPPPVLQLQHDDDIGHSSCPAEELSQVSLSQKTVKFLTERLALLTGKSVRKRKKVDLIKEILEIQEKRARLE